MAFFLAGIWSVAMSIFFWIVAKGLEKSERQFQENSLSLEGTIISYGRSTNASIFHVYRGMIGVGAGYRRRVGVRQSYRYYRPTVSFAVDGKIFEYQAGARNMNRSTHPLGTKVKILYYVQKTFIGETVDVRVDEEGYRPSPAAIDTIGLKIGAVICFVVAIILIILAVINI